MNKLILLFLIPVLLISFTSGYVFDNFADGIVNQSIWRNSTTIGTGNWVTESSSQLRINGNNANAGAVIVWGELPLPNYFIRSVNFSTTRFFSCSGCSFGSNWQVFNQTVIAYTDTFGSPYTENIGVTRLGNSNIFKVSNASTWITNITPTNGRSFYFDAFTGGGSGYTREVYSGAITYETFGVWNNLTSPLNNTQLLSTVNLQVNNTGILEFNLTNVTYYIYRSNGTLLNRTNYTITGKSNITNPSFTISDIGNYIWSANTCGTNGSNYACYNADNKSFTYGSFAQEYESSLISGQTSYALNITSNNLNSNLKANIIINGTTYTTSKNVINSTFYRFTSNINIPSTLGSVSGNVIQHYWNYYLDDGSINGTTSNASQTIYNVGFDSCGTFTNNLINFTIANENTLVNLSNSQNVSSLVYLTLTDKSNSSNYFSFNSSYSSNPARICISSSSLSNNNYRLDYEVRYTAQDYAIEYYNIQNDSLSIYPKNINLYLLPVTDAQEFQIEYRDRNFLLVPDVVIQIDRQYLNLATFLTVESPVTDTNGKTIGSFVLNDAVYNVYIKKDGVILASFLNSRAFCEVSIESCVIKLNERSGTSQINSASLVNGVSLNSYYNQTTRLFTTIFSVPSGNSKTISLNISRYDQFLNTSLCSTSLTAVSGTLSCTIPSSYLNQTAIAKIYIDGIDSSTSIFYVGDNFDFGQWKYFLALGLFLTLVGIGVGNKLVIGVSLIIGIVLAGALNLLELGGILGTASTILWLIVVIILINHKIDKGSTDAN